MFHKILFAILIYITQISLAYCAELRLDEKEFVYVLAEGWDILDQKRSDKFYKAELSNKKGSVIQLAVLPPPAPNISIADVRDELRSVHGKIKTRDTFVLLYSRIKEISPFGEVEEELWLDKNNNLLSLTRNVYSDNYVAIFTLTYNIEKDGSDLIKASLSGFSWK